MKDFIYQTYSKIPAISAMIHELNKMRRVYKFYKIKPQCSLADFIDFLLKPRPQYGVGRGMECEIHIDGDFLFGAFGALGAGLAFLTYQAITMAGRRRRKRRVKIKQNENILYDELADLLRIGIYHFFLLIHYYRLP